MQPQNESQYDSFTIVNVLEEDFYWQMGEDSQGQPIEFMLPEGEEVTLQRYAANHAIKKMTQRAIQKFEWHEKENKRGDIIKQYGGILQNDPELKKKWREKIVKGVTSITVNKKEKTFGETVKEQFQAAMGKTGSDDAFANLNQSGDEVSKMSYPKLKKVATALGINSSEKGMTQDKLRDAVREAMAADE